MHNIYKKEDNNLVLFISHTRTEGFAGELLSKRSTRAIVELMLGMAAEPET